MIKVLTQEYRENNLAVRTTVITFFCIPIYKFKTTTTNNKVVGSLTVLEERKQIKGF